MNARHVLPRAPWRCRGFTLVELMVAMLLGLIVIAGVSSVFLANLRSYHTNTALSDVQSNARIAFELMARDIRQAGLTGCNSMNGQVDNALNGYTANWWSAWSSTVNNTVRGYAGDATDPAMTASVPARAASTDSVMLMGATGQPLSVKSSTGSSFTLNNTSANLAAGDILMVCNPGLAVIFQAATTGTGPVTINYAASTTPVPGNASSSAGYAALKNFGNNASLSQLAVDDWYIGSNPVGGTSLYRATLTTNAGAPTIQAQEMVRNVTDMVITYHQGTATDFVGADAVTDWSQVNAVHVVLTLQSTDQRAGTNGKALVRTFAATTSIRNRT